VESCFFQTVRILSIIVARVNNVLIAQEKRQMEVIKMVDRTMYLYHVTTKNLWFPVASQGLQTMYSNGSIPSVWLVSRHALRWAISHTCKRHNCKPHHLIVVRVRVRRSWLRKNKVSGAWYCVVDIPPSRIEFIQSWPVLDQKMKASFRLWRVLPNYSISDGGE